jgi:hypothetical protein
MATTTTTTTRYIVRQLDFVIIVSQSRGVSMESVPVSLRSVRAGFVVGAVTLVKRYVGMILGSIDTSPKSPHKGGIRRKTGTQDSDERFAARPNIYLAHRPREVFGIDQLIHHDNADYASNANADDC